MDWNKENIIAALILVASANITGIANIYSPNVRADSFTALDAQIMKQKILVEVSESDEELELRQERQALILNNLVYRVGLCEKQ